MELEYKLAELIGKAKTDEQWRNALNAMADTGWNLAPEVKTRLNALLIESSTTIREQSNEFYDLCFELRKDYGFHNAIAKVATPDTTIRIYEPEEVTAENVAKVAAGMKYVNDTDPD